MRAVHEIGTNCPDPVPSSMVGLRDGIIALGIEGGEGDIEWFGSTERKSVSNVEQAASLQISTEQSISRLYALRLTRTGREQSKYSRMRKEESDVDTGLKVTHICAYGFSVWITAVGTFLHSANFKVHYSPARKVPLYKHPFQILP